MANMYLISLQSTMDQAPLLAVVDDVGDVLPTLRAMVDSEGAAELPHQGCKVLPDPDGDDFETLDYTSTDDWSVIRYWCSIGKEVAFDLSSGVFSPDSYDGESSLVVTRLDSFGLVVDGWSGKVVAGRA